MQRGVISGLCGLGDMAEVGGGGEASSAHAYALRRITNRNPQIRTTGSTALDRAPGRVRLVRPHARRTLLE